jgi:hypothetical protein
MQCGSRARQKVLTPKFRTFQGLCEIYVNMDKDMHEAMSYQRSDASRPLESFLTTHSALQDGMILDAFRFVGSARIDSPLVNAAIRTQWLFYP